MTSGVWLIGWYARRDLFNWRAAWRFTVPLVLTLVVLTGGVLVGWGWTRGAARVRQAEFAVNPFVVWVGPPPGGGVAGAVEPDKLAALVREVGDRGRVVPHWKAFVWANNSTGLRFRLHSNKLYRALPDGGRTADSDDPALARLIYDRRTPGRLTDRPHGLVVSRPMLDFLEFPPDAVPNELWVQMPSGVEAPVTVTAVVAKPISPGHPFVLTPEYERKLIHDNPDSESDFLLSGPVPAAYPPPDQLSEADRGELLKLSSSLNLPEREEGVADGVVRWRWGLMGARKERRSWWVNVLREADRIVGERYPAADAERRAFTAPTNCQFAAAAVELPVRAGYDAAGVWVTDPAGLRAASDACKAAGFAPADDLLQEYEALDEQARKGDRWLVWLVAGGAVAGGLMLGAVQRVYAAHKRPEVGLLKAMGFGPGRLLGLTLAEAGVVWAIGTAVGLGLGYLVGYSVAEVRRPDGVPPGLGMWAPWWVAAGVAAGAAVITSASALFGTWSVINRPPSESLSGR